MRRNRSSRSAIRSPRSASTAALGSVDFFTVPTVTGRVLFVFVVLLHQRRRIVHFNITASDGGLDGAAKSLMRFLMTPHHAGWRGTATRSIARRSVNALPAWVSRKSAWRRPVRGQNPFAERLIGHLARLPERHGGIRRAAFAPSPDRLLCVRSRIAHETLVGERRANAPTRAERHRA